MRKATAWLVGILCLVIPWSARADRSQWRGLVSVSSDHIDRGYSRSPNRAALQASVGWKHTSGWSAGLWSSTTGSAHAEDSIEWHGFAGYSTSFGEAWSAGLLFAHYALPEVLPGTDVSYEELVLSVQYKELFAMSLSQSDQVFGSRSEASFLELSGRYPLPLGFDLVSGLGYARFSRYLDPYPYGHLGIARLLGRIELEAKVVFSDAPHVPNWGEAVDQRFVASASMPLF